ncbi:MAG: hypothetical protein M9932_02450 [Xanthobacteraceae bacterium]|nr:hypothetical protein [Xanthobacteraceae bacterium]
MPVPDVFPKARPGRLFHASLAMKHFPAGTKPFLSRRDNRRKPAKVIKRSTGIQTGLQNGRKVRATGERHD